MVTRSEAYPSIAGGIREAVNVEDRPFIKLTIDQELPGHWNEGSYHWFRTKGPYTESNPSQLVLWKWFGERPGHWPVGEYQPWSSREPDLEITLDHVQMERLLELILDPTLLDKVVHVLEPSGDGAGCGWPRGSLIENALAGKEQLLVGQEYEVVGDVVWRSATLTSSADAAKRLAERRPGAAHRIYWGTPKEVGLHYPEDDPSGEPEVTMWLHRYLMPGEEFQKYSWRREVTSRNYPREVLILELWEEDRWREKFHHTIQLEPEQEARLRELLRPGDRIHVRGPDDGIFVVDPPDVGWVD